MKQYNLVLYLLLFLVSLLGCKHKNTDNTIILNLIGYKYDKLNLQLHLDNDSIIIKEGITKSGEEWKFICPDSLYNYVKYAKIIVPSDIDSLIQSISINIITRGAFKQLLFLYY